MKTYAEFPVQDSVIVKSSFSIPDANSGFSLCFGYSGSGGSFQSGSLFVGNSGYIFDQDNNFFGGYKQDQIVDLVWHMHSGQRISYFYKNKLIANNLTAPLTGVNMIEFDKHSDGFVNFDVTFEKI